jgi:hypothetical protein
MFLYLYSSLVHLSQMVQLSLALKWQAAHSTLAPQTSHKISHHLTELLTEAQ